MYVEKDNLTKLIIDSLMEVLVEREGEDAHQFEDFDETTWLVGRRSAIDSVGLVSLIVIVEQKLLDIFGVSVIIADERAFSLQNSPFRTIGSLSEYVKMLVEEAKNYAAS